MERLNVYGDSANDALRGYGVDISLQRSDMLDIALLDSIESSEIKNLRVLDLGCANGGQSIKLASRGCNVTAVDKQNFSKEIEDNCGQHKIDKTKISFIECDIRHTDEYLAGTFHYVYSQRTFHYINYKDSEKLLSTIRQYFVQDYESKLFISVSGIESELGEDYKDKNKPVEHRFCRLSKKMSARHKILAPICLYNLGDFQDLLIKCKYKIDRIYQSEFGNIKAVTRPS